MVVMVTAEEIVDKIVHGGGMLDDWMGDTRLTLGLSGNDQMMVMVKGLQKYYSKTKTLANKEFTAAARAGLDGNQANPATLDARPAKEVIEKELVRLQVEQGCFLVHGES